MSSGGSRRCWRSSTRPAPSTSGRSARPARALGPRRLEDDDRGAAALPPRRVGGHLRGDRGATLKLWLSDETTERWGAVYLWESREAAQREVPSRARELIGKDPDIVEEFDLEASVEGRYFEEELSRLGLAFD